MEAVRGSRHWVGLAFVGMVAAGCHQPQATEEPLSVRARALVASSNEAVLGFEESGRMGRHAGNDSVPHDERRAYGRVVVARRESVRVRCPRQLTPFGSFGAHWGDLVRLVDPGDASESVLVRGHAALLLLSVAQHLQRLRWAGGADWTRDGPLSYDGVLHLRTRPHSRRSTTVARTFPFAIAINVPWNETGTYLLDNLQVATAGDHLRAGPELRLHPRFSETYYARFSYRNDAASAVAVQIGSRTTSAQGAVRPTGELPPGSSPETFTVAFDGTPLSWHLGREVVNGVPPTRRPVLQPGCRRGAGAGLCRPPSRRITRSPIPLRTFRVARYVSWRT